MMSEDTAYQALTLELSARISFLGEYRFYRVRHNDDFIFMDIDNK
jgi:hypothetical protein